MRLCFGSLLTVMEMRPSTFATNPALCAAMFSTVAEGYLALDGSNVSAYAAGRINVPGNISEGASKADPHAVSRSFRDSVMKYVDRNKRKDVVLALQDIVTGFKKRNGKKSCFKDERKAAGPAASDMNWKGGVSA